MSGRGGLTIDYAPTGRASCKSCGRGIGQDSLRVAQETKSDYHDGWDTSYHHSSCCRFPDGTGKYGPVVKGLEDLKHWEILRWDDQLDLKKKCKVPITETPADKERKNNNNAVWALKDELKDSVTGKMLKALCEANGHDVEKLQGPTILQLVAEEMTNGRIGPCSECGNLQMVHNGIEYKCYGWAPSGFTRCSYKGPIGERFKFYIPEEYKKVGYFKEWTYPKGHPTKVLDPSAKSGGSSSSSSSSTQPSEGSQPVVDDSKEEDEVPVGQELYGMVVMFAGSQKDLKMSQDDLSTLVVSHGGEVSNEYTDDVSFLITSETEINKKKLTKKVTAALDKIPAFSVEFLTNLAERKEESINLRKNEVAVKYLLSPSKIGSKPIVNKKYRTGGESSTSSSSTVAPGEAPVSSNTKRKQREPRAGSDILKVDAAAKLGSAAKIVVTYDDETGFSPYNAMLNVADVTTGQNKYYRMQAIHCGGKRWVFFIKYGRVGTDVGDQKTYEFRSEKGAIEEFEGKFYEKTGNRWSERGNFVKKGGKYFMVDLDDGAEEEKVVLKRQKTEGESSGSSGPSAPIKKPESELDERVQNLMRLMFDTEMMKKTLVAMEVDIKKMPLGKISSKQIKQGYQVLSEIQDLITSHSTSAAKFADCANRFYTLIPHDFGTSAPPIIDNLEVVKKKMSLLEALVDMEIATSLMAMAEASTDPVVDANYKSLKTKIEPLDRAGTLYRQLERYALDTHDKGSFRNFDIVVEDIFAVERHAERDRFIGAGWDKSVNRQLLWHGSRITNWVGIISQGLRIAPPEAPKTGYRFGKGVYFADCISKSGSYCFTTATAPTGLMILSEVALGTMNELKNDTYMEKAPPGTHSTKALGMAHPDPKHDQLLEGSDIKVPLGKIVPSGLKTACTHNEFIVYDVAQVHIKYMLRIKFVHKSHY
eukprot:TRINITY_DN4671_c0_g1_i1.p1 TRINITY_DN4671_c0_g1~~TRINITY_DN4671_c0_g1_i1.p1  ORF type:complete len:930 (+),score=212.19 TRINITY_DN4671_c0_g1_i1:193-2982(+)